jgi:4-hydroxybenzoate polyprenyltransferase
LKTRILFRSLVYSDLFIAFCALMMAWETQQVFSIQNRDILLFIFFSTLCSYSFHSLLNTIYPSTTERHEWNIHHKAFLVASLVITASVVLVYTWRLRGGLLFIGFAALFTFLYSAPIIPMKPFILLRRIAYGKTIFLALVWTYVTGMMPILISGVPLKASHFYFVGSRLFLVYAICILFDLRDRIEDRKKKIKALPTVLSEKSIRFIYFLSLFFSLICTIMVPFSGIPLHEFIFMLIPVIICLLIYGHSLTRKDDLYYYVILDGLMMLSALLLFIYSISFTFVP